MKPKKMLALAAAMTVCSSYGTPVNKLPYLSSATERFTFAVPVKKAPVIDGKLEKEVWGNIPRTKYFTVRRLLTNSVTKQTSFQIGYDDKYLYLAATMWESEPDLIKEGANVRDSWPITDRINFIFSKVYNQKGGWQDSPYIFLMFGAGGIHRGFYNELPGKVEKPLKVDAGEWITGYSKDKTRWYIESRIPLKLLGLTAADEQIFLNVRRDMLNEPKEEASTTWNPFANAKLDAHSFGTLYLLKGNPKAAKLESRINGRSKYAYQSGLLGTLTARKGEYIGAKQTYGSQPGWEEAEALIDKFKAFYDAEFKKNPWTISDQLDDYYMEWKKIIRKLEKSSPATPMEIKTRNAKVLSVKLNGRDIKLKNGSYDLSLIAGINALEITAEAAGQTPGVQFALKGSPETSADFYAAAPGAKDDEFKPADVKDGSLWSGNLKKVVFRQNLIWSRTYGNHPLAFLGPQVKEWGVSPGETMHFIHIVYNPKNTGKCNYKLIAEIPEGFTRVNDFGGAIAYNHYPTRDVKTEKITVGGRKYIRYTYTWNLPQSLHRNMPCHFHNISFRHDGYKFAKGEKVDFRFRRIVDGNTTDLVNVVKVAELPPVNGGKLTKIIFPQYDWGMCGPVSKEQLRAMVDGSFQAGMNSFICSPPYYHMLSSKSYAAHIERGNYLKSLVRREGAQNFTWPLFNIPLWGAGKGTPLAELVLKTPDLQAKYYNNTGAYAKDWHVEFCLTNATGKYRKQFKEALKKCYQYCFDYGVGKNLFFNDENYPAGNLNNWKHSYCFCDVCKADFRAMFKIPASEKLDDETIVTTYKAQWNKWWKHKQKNLLLALTHETVREMGGKILYYHNTHDTEAFAESKGHYDILSIPVPGYNYVGGWIQERMDAQKQNGEKITGIHQSVGQIHIYLPNNSRKRVLQFSSDNFFLYPKEQKMLLVRIVATTHKGAFMESAAYFSAGCLYYLGEATRMIAAYEDIFHDGYREDKLAVSDTFKYPNLLVLKKGDERLVLIFNESHDKAMTGTIRNLNLKPGQKASLWESRQVFPNAASIKITVQPQDVAAVHIK